MSVSGGDVSGSVEAAAVAGTKEDPGCGSDTRPGGREPHCEATRAQMSIIKHPDLSDVCRSRDPFFGWSVGWGWGRVLPYARLVVRVSVRRRITAAAAPLRRVDGVFLQLPRTSHDVVPTVQPPAERPTFVEAVGFRQWSTALASPSLRARRYAPCRGAEIPAAACGLATTPEIPFTTWNLHIEGVTTAESPELQASRDQAGVQAGARGGREDSFSAASCRMGGALDSLRCSDDAASARLATFMPPSVIAGTHSNSGRWGGGADTAMGV